MAKNDGLVLRGDTWHMNFSLRGIAVRETTRTSNRRAAEQMLALRKAEIINKTLMGKLKTIRLPSPNSGAMMTVWVQIAAQNPIDARSMLQVQYGKANVIGPAVQLK